MTKTIFVVAAAIYWICFLARAYLWHKEWTTLARRIAVLEKAGILVFTLGLVVYIGKLQIIEGQVHLSNYDMPVSFLLFAWAISAANLVTEIIYNNRWSALFSNLWTGLCLTLSPAAAAFFRGLFTYDLDWLNFHRLCFLLGYAFCTLAFPLVLYFCLYYWRTRQLTGAQAEEARPKLWSLDRMAYRMVLWALPLLTAGILAEALLLLELNQLPGPQDIWNQKQETLLALAAWFLCGIYLHTRLFYGWRNLRAAGLYLVGMALLVAGHVTYGISSHS